VSVSGFASPASPITLTRRIDRDRIRLMKNPAMLVILLFTVTGTASAKQKHVEADYKVGWLERWTAKDWGPDVYYDSQNGLTCFAAHDHELPQCYKDSNNNEWVVRISDDDYMQITMGDSFPRPMFAAMNKENALLDLTSQCLAAATSESTRRIAAQEVAAENSVPQGRVTVVECAVQVRYRIEGNVLYTPLYRKGKLSDEVGYDNVFLEHTPGGHAVGVSRNNFFVDVWDYSGSK